MQVKWVIAGENAIKFWCESLTPGADKVNVALYPALRQKLKQAGWPWLEDIVAAETSITVFFHLLHVDFQTVRTAVFAEIQRSELHDIKINNPLITLPIKYGAEVGQDLAEVADRCGLAPEDVIQTHQETLFTVTAVGFSPGFGYLKGLPDTLRLPRRADPRTNVPRGAVAIAEDYTAVYPQSSPGGWHLIGYCPEPLFDISLPVPALFNVGQQVRFIAIE